MLRQSKRQWEVIEVDNYEHCNYSIIINIVIIITSSCICGGSSSSKHNNSNNQRKRLRMKNNLK